VSVRIRRWPVTFCAGDSVRRHITPLFLSLTVGLGLTQILACRYELNPDSLDYLDIARQLAVSHWSALANDGTSRCK
jgi:hypothetical protein